MISQGSGYRVSYHDSSSNIFDGPEIQGEKQNDADEQANETAGEEASEQVEEKGRESEEEVGEGDDGVL